MKNCWGNLTERIFSTSSTSRAKLKKYCLYSKLFPKPAPVAERFTLLDGVPAQKTVTVVAPVEKKVPVITPIQKREVVLTPYLYELQMNSQAAVKTEGLSKSSLDRAMLAGGIGLTGSGLMFLGSILNTVQIVAARDLFVGGLLLLGTATVGIVAEVVNAFIERKK